MSETVIDFKDGKIKNELKALLATYDKYRSNIFTDSITFKCDVTEQLLGDIRSEFFKRVWYTPDYIESLSDADEKLVDLLLDGYDKLGDISVDHDRKTVCIVYDFLYSKEEINFYLNNSWGLTLDHRMAMKVEIDNLDIIMNHINKIIKAQ